MREQPDAGALMADFSPVLQRNHFIDLAETFAEIGSALSYSESICIRADLDVMYVSLNMSRKSAAVARYNKAYSLGFPYICNDRVFSHHDDISIPKQLSYILGHIQAVARTRITENNILFHYKSPLTIYRSVRIKA